MSWLWSGVMRTPGQSVGRQASAPLQTSHTRSPPSQIMHEVFSQFVWTSKRCVSHERASGPWISHQLPKRRACLARSFFWAVSSGKGQRTIHPRFSFVQKDHSLPRTSERWEREWMWK